MTGQNKRLAILCAGGPAPGLNSVIAAATIRAELSGVEVLGVQDGFARIMKGDLNAAARLSMADVSRIHFRGGSTLGISRANPTHHTKDLETTLLTLLRLNVDKLITIGGDGTAFSAHRLEQFSEGQLRVVHVPKTIDNDLALPPEVDTFGFQTARHEGANIVKNLMNDAKATRRWYLVVTAGRKAGHLALGIGKAAGATLTLIPEEFPQERVPLQTIVDTVVGAILKRHAIDRHDGVVVLAEGLLEKLRDEDLALMDNGERDMHNNLKFGEIDFANSVKIRVKGELQARGIRTPVVGKHIGYELRCCDPVPFDIDYTRDLGYCAARFVIDGGSGVMVSMQGGRFIPIPLAEMVDESQGRARVRMVDIDSDRYRIARTYMVRLRADDFDDMHQLTRLAAVVGMGREEFRARYSYLVEHEPSPIGVLSRMPPRTGVV